MKSRNNIKIKSTLKKSNKLVFCELVCEWGCVSGTGQHWTKSITQGTASNLDSYPWMTAYCTDKGVMGRGRTSVEEGSWVRCAHTLSDSRSSLQSTSSPSRFLPFLLTGSQGLMRWRKMKVKLCMCVIICLCTMWLFEVKVTLKRQKVHRSSFDPN